MKRQEFDELVRRLETRYAGRQGALERAIAMWVKLGLAAVLFWLLLVTGVGVLLFVLGTFLEPPGGIVLIVIAVPLTLYGLLQTLYLLRVESSPVEGRLLAPDECPVLHDLLDKLRRDVECRPFDEIRITLDLNASVREQPRLGLFGRSRTILQIGLPLAQAMAPNELEAILAHELMHISARHVRGLKKVNRLTATWGRLFQTMQRPTADSFVRMSRTAIARFINWFWPRLNARGLVLSRVHELEADREAGRTSGNLALAMALWRLATYSPWISERFWPDVFARSSESLEPPVDIASRLAAAIQTPPKPEDADLWSARALARATLPDETHPALLERVRQLGVAVDDLQQIGFPKPPNPSAADVLLAGSVITLERELSEQWRKEVIGTWRDRHRRATAEFRRKSAAAAVLEPTETLAQPAPTADTHGLWETACDVLHHQGLSPAVPFLERVLEIAPNHDGATVLLGRHRALAGDVEGELMLLRVLERNTESWIPAACEALQELYRATGRMDQFRQIRARMDRHEADQSAAQLERSSISASDAFLPHELASDTLASLLQLLATFPNIEAAWLVRKQLRHFPDRPMFVLCIRAKRPGRWPSRTADEEQSLVRRLISKVELPGQVLIISSKGYFASLARKIIKSPRSQVFRPPSLSESDQTLAEPSQRSEHGDALVQ